MSFTKQLSICFFCLVAVSPIFAQPTELPEDCGRLISGTDARYAIYAYCPSLPQLSAEQALELVIALLEGTNRRSGHTVIVFVRTESVPDRDRWRSERGLLSRSWSQGFVGVYHTRSQLLTVRTVTDDGWRDVYLPTARN